jgi:hypothetical protein
MGLTITTKTTKDELIEEVERLHDIEAELEKLKAELRDKIGGEVDDLQAQSDRLDLDLGPIGPTEVQRRGWQTNEKGYVYKFVGSCKSDLGYNVDSLMGRAVYAANDAFSLDKLGVDKGGNAAWEGFPAFSTEREIIVTVEVR